MKKLTKSAQFAAALTRQLAKKPVTFMSETDSAPEVVTLDASDIRGWKREANTTDLDVAYQAASGAEGWAELASLFVDGSRQEVKLLRATDEQSVYDLYLLNRFGPTYCGLKIRVVNT